MSFERLESRTLLDASLLITEFSAANSNGIRDEDGDRSDWIELYNQGDEPAELDGWFLTDDPQRLNKWQLPAVSVDPRTYEIIFASGKNRADSSSQLHTSFKLDRAGEYLGLVEPDGQTVVAEYAPAYPGQLGDYSFGLPQKIINTTVLASGVMSTVMIPTDDSAGGSWTRLAFDDSGWTLGPTGVGFGRTPGFSDLIGTTDVRLDMIRARTGSAYVRVPFTVETTGPFSTLMLRMKYDDGFVAYLNGQEVARRNTPGTVQWNSTASRSHADDAATVFEEIDITEFLPELRSGENVLAIQALNLSNTDGDFLMVPELVVSQPGEVDMKSPSFFAFPSPGLPNGSGSSMYVDTISHTPNTPRDNEDLAVTATVFSLNDQAMSLTLNYRVMFGAEVALPMFDDGLHADGKAGDNIYGATIPAGVAKPGQMIRYYVTAEQANGSTSRWPNYFDPLDSEEYFGTVVQNSDVETSRLPVMELFMRTPSRADTRDGTRGSIFYAGELYDNVRIDLHGRGSVGFPKKSHDIDFNRDHRFKATENTQRVKNINLITNYGDRSMMRNTLVNEALGVAGAGGHLAFPVRTQLNGKFYAVYDLIEEPDEQFLERIGRDPDGALYKINGPLGPINGIKETRKFDSKADLQALVNGLRRPAGLARSQFLYDNINLPEMANFLAMLTIAVHSDCCSVNFYMYRDTNGTGEWEAFPFDFDNSMGNWVFQKGLRTQEPLYRGKGSSPFNALYADAGFDQMYLRRLRTLMDKFYGPPGLAKSSEGWFDQRIDELTKVLAPDAPLDNAKWPPWGSNPTWQQQVSVLQDVFVPERRDFLYGQTIARGGLIPDAQPSNTELKFGRIEASPKSGNQDEEFIELTNPNRYAVDLSGWSLAGDVNLPFKLGTVIPAGESLFISPDVKAFRARASRPSGDQATFVQGAYSSRLSNTGGTVEVLDPAGRVAASTTYRGEPTPTEQYLRITELMYNPADFAVPGQDDIDNNALEFVELRNTSGTTQVDLSDVRLNRGIRFDFADSNVQQLEPGQFVLVVKDRAAFESRYGTGFLIAGEYEGSLSNGGELIILEESGTAVLEFEYRDDWYPSTDGGGSSLVIVDPLLAPARWNERFSWRPSGSRDGSPGTSDDGIIGDANGDGRFDSSDLIALFQAGEYEDGVVANSIFAEGDWNGDGEFDSADLILAFQLGAFDARRPGAGKT